MRAVLVNRMGGDLGSNLEMRCSADQAWYDGTLSFSAYSKDVIVVHFNDFGEEEDETFPTSDLLDPRKLKSRVRVRSYQLQDCQCKLVVKGQSICGCLDDGEDRKYYDSKVVSIVGREHLFKNDGEECNCNFELLWLDGPKRKELTTVGCAEICFLSNDAPDEDPMVKSLVKSLLKSAPNTTPPLRTPSSSLEVAPTKKQSSKEPSPSTHRVQLGQQARAKSVGSKKKRIRRPEAITEQPDLASDNDALNSLEMDARPTTSTPTKEPSRDGSEKVARAGHDDESDDSERRVRGGESSKERFVPVEQTRLKVKASKVIVPAPEVVVCEEEAAVREEDIPRSSFRELVKANAKKMAAPEVAAASDEADLQTLGQQVKLNLAKKSKPASQVESEKVSPQKKKPDSKVGSEKVSLQKKKPDSKVGSRKVSLQKAGLQVVGKQMQKNHKQMQLEDHPSRLSSKHDELADRPETPSRPNDVAVEPKEPQKRKPGRPRKHPPPEPVKTGTESLASKKQPVLGFSKEQRQNSQEEIIDAVNAEKQSSDPANMKKTAKKKRPWEEDSSLPDTDDIGSNKSTQDEGEAHVTTKQAPGGRGNKEKKTKRPWKRDRQPQNDDAVSDTSADDDDHTPVANKEKKTARPRDCEWQPQHDDAACDKFAGAHTVVADDDEDHTPVATPVDAPNKRLGCGAKRSMADGVRNIQNKFGLHRQQQRETSHEKTPSRDAHEAITPGSSEELVGPPPRGGNQTEDNTRVSQLRVTQNETTKIGASGKRRRTQTVLTDEEEDDDDGVPKKPKADMHGSVESSANGQDECNDPKTTSTSALDEELQTQDAVKATRLLLIKNMETDVSEYDVMQLLQDETEGACAVHVLPVPEFQTSATGYALYRDGGSALRAVQHLASRDRFVVSPKGRPWIVSLATNVDGPRLCGFSIYSAYYKSDNPGICGIISCQPQVQNLLVVTKQRDSSAYSQALQRSKTYEEHQKWHKELHDRIVQEEMKG